jgi:hypothetical protein
VEPEAEVTLFECPEPRPVGIEIIEVTDSGCVLLHSGQFDAGDFTIVLSGLRSGPYTLSLTPGAGLTGPPGGERTFVCMG